MSFPYDLAFAPPGTLQRSFAANGLRAVEGASLEAPSSADQLASGLAMQAVKVGAQPVSRWLMLAYDDRYSIQYMKRNLRPYWRRNGWEAADLLKAAAKEYETLKQRCAAFDDELMADLVKAGGEKYARL